MYIGEFSEKALKKARGFKKAVNGKMKEISNPARFAASNNVAEMVIKFVVEEAPLIMSGDSDYILLERLANLIGSTVLQLTVDSFAKDELDLARETTLAAYSYLKIAAEVL